jgi:hypothetical protein
VLARLAWSSRGGSAALAERRPRREPRFSAIERAVAEG